MGDLPLLRAFLALAGVLLLLGAVLWLLRRHAGPLQRLAAGGRLAITASQVVDARVRLVLVRRDGVEHLLAVSPAGITVVETLRAAGGGPAGEPAS
jgi:flagellar protein FliO/FliZ